MNMRLLEIRKIKNVAYDIIFYKTRQLEKEDINIINSVMKLLGLDPNLIKITIINGQFYSRVNPKSYLKKKKKTLKHYISLILRNISNILKLFN